MLSYVNMFFKYGLFFTKNFILWHVTHFLLMVPVKKESLNKYINMKNANIVCNLYMYHVFMCIYVNSM